jgi:hypothetical protein
MSNKDPRLGEDTLIHGRLHPPVRPPSAELKSPPEVITRSIFGRIIDRATIGSLDPEEADVHRIYKPAHVKAEPRVKYELPQELEKWLTEAADWPKTAAVEELVSNLDPAQAAELLTDRTEPDSLTDQELALKIIRGIKIQLALSNIFADDKIGILELGQHYASEQRETAVNLALGFLSSRDGVDIRFKQGVPLPDQLLLTWPKLDKKSNLAPDS